MIRRDNERIAQRNIELLARRQPLTPGNAALLEPVTVYTQDQIDPSGLTAHKDTGKKMVTYLRHGINKEMTIRSDGFVPITQLKNHFWVRYGRKLTTMQICAEVAMSAKGRYELGSVDDAMKYIRCTQGHSVARIDPEKLLTRITATAANQPPVLLHGTSWMALPMIMEAGLIPGGLKTGSRSMNHFGGFRAADPLLRAGARHKAEVSTYWDVDQSFERPPLKWWRSLRTK